MKILVSACLAGENCKYNGGNNRNGKVLELFHGNEVITICPEVLGGLPTPRIPAEICNGKVINRSGVSVDKEYHLGAEKALEIGITHHELPDGSEILIKINYADHEADGMDPNEVKIDIKEKKEDKEVL